MDQMGQTAGSRLHSKILPFPVRPLFTTPSWFYSWARLPETIGRRGWLFCFGKTYYFILNEGPGIRHGAVYGSLLTVTLKPVPESHYKRAGLYHAHATYKYYYLPLGYLRAPLLMRWSYVNVNGPLRAYYGRGAPGRDEAQLRPRTRLPAGRHRQGSHSLEHRCRGKLDFTWLQDYL